MIPWRRKWQPAPVFLPGKSDGQRSLVGYSPQGCKRIGPSVVTKEQQNLSNTNTNMPSSVLWATVESSQLVCAYRLLVLPIGFGFTSEALFIFKCSSTLHRLLRWKQHPDSPNTFFIIVLIHLSNSQVSLLCTYQ